MSTVPGLGEDRADLARSGLNRPNLRPVGSNVIALQAINATANGSSIRRLENRGRRSPSIGAEIIPLNSRRSTALARLARRRLDNASKHAATGTGDDHDSATREDGNGPSMLENLVAIVWLGALMTFAYYLINALSTA
jgi:hypothetical protein